MAQKRKALSDDEFRKKVQKTHGDLGTFHVEEKVGAKTWKLYKEARSTRAAQLYLEMLEADGKVGRVLKISDEF